MPISPRLSRAVGHYDPSNESEFRGDVDRAIKSLENQIALLRGARSNEFAKSALRENSIISDGGIDSYPDNTGYFSGNQAIAYASKTYTSTLTYFGLTGGYVNEVEQDFSEDASTGNIEYSGTRTAKFLVQYGASLRCNAFLSHYDIYLRIDKNGSAVSGSAIRDNYYGDFAAFGSWFRNPRLSGSIIVELATDETISVEIGIDASAVSDASGNLGTGADGVSLCITEVSY